MRSARYAGEEATDEENNKLLLQTMKFQVKRTCRFRCALAVAAPNGKILLESDGICDGMLLHEPLGTEDLVMILCFGQQNCIRVWARLRCRRKIKSAIAAKLLKNLLRIGGK